MHFFLFRKTQRPAHRSSNCPWNLLFCCSIRPGSWQAGGVQTTGIQTRHASPASGHFVKLQVHIFIRFQTPFPSEFDLFHCSSPQRGEAAQKKWQVPLSLWITWLTLTEACKRQAGSDAVISSFSLKYEKLKVKRDASFSWQMSPGMTWMWGHCVTHVLC